MNWQAKLIALGVLGLLVLGVYSYIQHQSSEIKDLSKQNTTLEVANQGIQKSMQDDQKSDAVSDAVVKDAVNDPITVKNDQAIIDKSTHTQTQAVVKKYKEAPTPATPEAVAAQTAERAKEISRIRVTAMWQTYCNAVPSNPKCAAIPKPN